MKTTADVTQMLLAWGKGDQGAFEHLLPLVYDELRLIADRYLKRERAGHTLQATALVHEAYLKLVNQQQVEWQNRAHFYGIAAHAMRRILIDHARNRQAEKRGSGEAPLSLDEKLIVSESSGNGGWPRPGCITNSIISTEWKILLAQHCSYDT
jgi:RNA polymerase sigma factor (TIGR02999 family)